LLLPLGINGARPHFMYENVLFLTKWSLAPFILFLTVFHHTAFAKREKGDRLLFLKEKESFYSWIEQQKK
jgi:hypothetical protein